MEAALNRFGHHPDLSTDFCCEVETLQGWVHDIRSGLRSQWPFWGRLSRLLKFCRGPAFEELDEIAKRARPAVQAMGVWGPDELFDRERAVPLAEAQ
jgi:hypothetical protein